MRVSVMGCVVAVSVMAVSVMVGVTVSVMAGVAVSVGACVAVAVGGVTGVGLGISVGVLLGMGGEVAEGVEGFMPRASKVMAIAVPQNSVGSGVTCSTWLRLPHPLSRPVSRTPRDNQKNFTRQAASAALFALRVKLRSSGMCGGIRIAG